MRILTILGLHVIKVDMQGVVAAMGPPCNAVSIKNHIAKLRAMAREQKAGGNSSDAGSMFATRQLKDIQRSSATIFELTKITAVANLKRWWTAQGTAVPKRRFLLAINCKFLKPPSCLSEISNSVSPRPTARGVLPCTNGRPTVHQRASFGCNKEWWQ